MDFINLDGTNFDLNDQEFEKIKSLSNKLENKNHKSNGTYKFDFHGYSIDNANKKVAELIRKCFEEKFSEILNQEVILKSTLQLRPI